MKISVVVPMYNASGTILKCLQALAGQDTLPDEVIVVDNNSTDRSKSVVQDWISGPKLLNVTLCEEFKKGPSAARNKGAYLATGDIIAFTDSDCIPDRSWIKRIKEAFTQKEDLDVIGGVEKISIFPGTVMGKYLSAFWFSGSDPIISEAPILRKEHFFDHKFILTFNCAFKRDIFKKINGFDETFDIGEDFDIILRAFDAGGKMIAWNKDMMVCHIQDMSLKSLLKREVFYTKGLVLNVNRHFRNSVFISIGHKHYHWPNNIGLTVSLFPNVPKVFLLVLAVLVMAYLSPVFLAAVSLLSFIYFCLKVRGRVKNSGLDLTVKETVMVFFIYAARVIAKFYGRIYWSFRYKIICL